MEASSRSTSSPTLHPVQQPWEHYVPLSVGQCALTHSHSHTHTIYITTCTPQKLKDNDKANTLSLNKLSVPKGPMD